MKTTIHGDKDGRCVLDETQMCDDCGECDRCDIDPTKICDNCGACINSYNTNEKGFVEIPVDKIEMTETDATLKDFYASLGLDDEDDDDDK